MSQPSSMRDTGSTRIRLSRKMRSLRDSEMNSNDWSTKRMMTLKG